LKRLGMCLGQGFAIASETAACPAGYVAGESGTRLEPSTRNADISPVLLFNAYENCPDASLTCGPALSSPAADEAPGRRSIIPDTSPSCSLLFTTRTSVRRVPEVANTVWSELSTVRFVMGGMATESSLLIVPVSRFTANAVKPASSAANRSLPFATSSVGEFGATNGDPGTGESPPSLLILNPRITPAEGSAVNRNCDGTTAPMPAGVGVGVGVIVGVGVGLPKGVGETVGVGEKPGLFVTIRRGEITPHAAISASADSTQRLTQKLRTGPERKCINKRDAASRRAVGCCHAKLNGQRNGPPASRY
jgi:hypothetical protein